MLALRKSLVVAAAATAILAAAAPVQASTPSGERIVGNAAKGHGAAIEPAYDYNTGQLTYLLTPAGAPFPSKANSHAIAPLYIVVYPSSYPGWTLNCMGVPGNCPDHDGEIAGAATAIMPSVYGTDPAGVPGHDHLVGLANTGGDYNVAWHVWVILFTSNAAANTHVTTLTQLQAALGNHSAISVDSGIIFNCSAVSAAAYWSGTPV
ncbi:MAG TPA: hypothetical protein VJ506_10230 [Candidatus Limnocylindrales bacterium]|nr:hypothetical protein [Candidatus Limnocylindrales bacterium]